MKLTKTTKWHLKTFRRCQLVMCPRDWRHCHVIWQRLALAQLVVFRDKSETFCNPTNIINMKVSENISMYACMFVTLSRKKLLNGFG